MERLGSDFDPRLNDASNVDDVAVPAKAARRSATFPAHSEVADPDKDWAAARPDQLMMFLYVSPRPCDALETIFAS